MDASGIAHTANPRQEKHIFPSGKPSGNNSCLGFHRSQSWISVLYTMTAMGLVNSKW